MRAVEKHIGIILPVDDVNRVYQNSKAPKHECYLVYLHGPLHPVLSCAERLVQPVRQSLSEALLKVCQLK